MADEIYSGRNKSKRRQIKATRRIRRTTSVRFSPLPMILLFCIFPPKSNRKATTTFSLLCLDEKYSKQKKNEPGLGAWKLSCQTKEMDSYQLHKYSLCRQQKYSIHTQLCAATIGQRVITGHKQNVNTNNAEIGTDFIG